MQVSNWDHNREGDATRLVMRLVVMRHWLLRLPHPLSSEDREGVPATRRAACHPADTCLKLLDPSGT